MIGDPDVFAWLGRAAVTLLTVVGGSALIIALLQRYWKNRDRQKEISETNDAAEITAEVDLVKILSNRVDALEKRHDATSEKLMSLTSDNSRLLTDNANLQRTNDRQQREIETLRREIRDLREIIRRLDKSELDRLYAVAESSEKSALRLKGKWKAKETAAVLVIDDVAESREVLATALMLNGIQCKGFASGTEALEWLGENDARIVVMDLAMPTIDGLALVGHIRKNETLYVDRRPCEIVFYTGHVIDDVIRNVQARDNVREIFEKGKHDPVYIASCIKSWLE
jgi:CheY-like chemotaxis protein